MSGDKLFLTYNQQMKKLRNDKNIACVGSTSKKILIRAGYFNIVNGYKTPFVSGIDSSGKHIYIPGTDLNQLLAVKKFDDALRLLLIKYISQIEEEVRTLAGYKFDECNDKGSIPWYSIDAYSPRKSLQNRMDVISKAYKEISVSQQEYVKFYLNNHAQIPTWITVKAINFATFIDLLDYSKEPVKHALCNLYGLEDSHGKPNVKLLIGSLHWMRKIRNSCAHNERIYCISRSPGPSGSRNNGSGRIKEKYFSALGSRYTRDNHQKLFDLIVYFKYYLPKNEFKSFIKEIKNMLLDLQSKIHPNAFDAVRGSMGIKNLLDLDALQAIPKDEIEYNKFDK